MKIHRSGLASVFAIALLAASCGAARADVRLPHIFGDHMVLQRESAVPVWGWADPGETVTVSSGLQSATATTGDDGKWKVLLGRLETSTKPIEVTVAGKNTIILHDVLVGDVWLCSGQSNMEFGITNDNTAKETIAQADQPLIRLFVVPKMVAPQPADEIGKAPELQGSWQLCTPDTISKDGLWGGFTAAGYYFGRNIQQTTGKPVGLIESCWGGTPAQSWTSLEGLQTAPELKHHADAAEKYSATFQQQMEAYPAALENYKAELEKWNQENKEAVDTFNAAMTQWKADAQQAAAENRPTVPPKPAPLKSPKAPEAPNQARNTPTGLYNGMIAPLVPYAIAGAIWYQGESNAGQAVEYRTLFPAMITDWRKQWGQGDFPFLFVQLANFQARKPEPGDSAWAMLREAQLKTLELPSTGMAVAIDLGEATDVHPRDKWDVAERLALAARYIVYDEKIAYSGPTYQEMKVEGSKIRIQFDHVEGGLVIGVPPAHFHPGEARTPEAELQGFAIAGADGKFVWAQAKIDGKTILVSSDAVPQPVAVRYAWADNPAANLYNKAGLPASPFRTDTDAAK